MKSAKTLANSNHHLKQQYASRMRARSIASSTAIETRQPISELEVQIIQKRFSRHPVKLA